jgi:hypothetical protein
MTERYREFCVVSDIPNDTTIPAGLAPIMYPSPLELDQEPYDLWCGGCENFVVVRGMSLATAASGFRDERGCFVTCKKCGKHNELASRTIS